MIRSLFILLAAAGLSACDYSAKDRLTDAEAEAAAVGPDLDNADNADNMVEDVNASIDAASNMAMGDGVTTNAAAAVGASNLDPNGPSFRCAGLLSHVEDMVCSNPELARSDRAASDSYAKAMKQGSSDQQNRLRAVSRRFLEERNSCVDAECVAQAYQGFEADIAGLMGWPTT